MGHEWAMTKGRPLFKVKVHFQVHTCNVYCSYFLCWTHTNWHCTFIHEKLFFSHLFCKENANVNENVSPRYCAMFLRLSKYTNYSFFKLGKLFLQNQALVKNHNQKKTNAFSVYEDTMWVNTEVNICSPFSLADNNKRKKLALTIIKRHIQVQMC